MTLFRAVERLIAKTLLVLMTVVVILAVGELGHEIYRSLTDVFISRHELFGLFGLFLIVLIGLELMGCIHMYLEHNRIHAEFMLLVALTAVTRKIVIIDTGEVEALTMFAIGFLVITLAVGYFLVHKRVSAKKISGVEETD